VDVDNAGGELLPGAYAQVHLELAGATGTLVVPVSALIFQSAGLRLATIDAANRAHLEAVTPGRDFGNEVEIVAGLAPGQRVIDSPPDSLVEGQQVRIVPAGFSTRK
jgi:hypothetical protein